MQPRIYVYKITFEEVLYYYYGVHKEKTFDEYYMGSPQTHKWCWELYTPKKQILEIFPYTDEGWIKAQEVEKRLIQPFYQTDQWCLNESCGGLISLEINRKTGQKTKELGKGIHSLTKEQLQQLGKKCYEESIGIHGFTKEQRSELGKKGGKISGEMQKELNIGIHGLSTEERKKNGKKGAEVARELNVGLYALTFEQRSENGKKSGKKGAETLMKNKLGIHGLTYEQRSEISKKVNSQKWKCLMTDYVSNGAGLTKYQRARGIDTSKRVRIE